MTPTGMSNSAEQSTSTPTTGTGTAASADLELIQSLRRAVSQSHSLLAEIIQQWPHKPEWSSFLHHIKHNCRHLILLDQHHHHHQHNNNNNGHANDRGDEDNNIHIEHVNGNARGDLWWTMVNLVFTIRDHPVPLQVVEEGIIPTINMHLHQTASLDFVSTPRSNNDRNTNINMNPNIGTTDSRVSTSDIKKYGSMYPFLECAFSNPNVRYSVAKILLECRSASASASALQSEQKININCNRKLISTAIQCNATEGVRAIIDHYPPVLLMKDALNLTPIHLVFSYQYEADHNSSSTLATASKSDMLQLLFQEGRKHGMHLAHKSNKNKRQLSCEQVQKSCTTTTNTNTNTNTTKSLWAMLKNGEMASFNWQWQWRWKAFDIRGAGNITTSPLDLSLYYLHKKYKRRNKPNRTPEEYDSADDWKCLAHCVQAAQYSDPTFDIVVYILGWRPTVYGFFMEMVRRLEIDLRGEDYGGRTPLLNSILQRPQRYHLIEQLLKLTAEMLDRENGLLLLGHDKEENEIDNDNENGGNREEAQLGAFKRYIDLDGKEVCNRHLLHVALYTKLQLNLVWDIVDLHPEALKTRDPLTGLYPFLQAARRTRETVTGVSNYNCPLDGIYHLLKEDPSVIELALEYGLAHSSSSGRDYAHDHDRARSHHGSTCSKSLNVVKESLWHWMQDMWNARHAMMAVAAIVVLMGIYLQYVKAGRVISIQ